MLIKWGKDKEKAPALAPEAPEPASKPAGPAPASRPAARPRTRGSRPRPPVHEEIHKDLAQVLLEEGTISPGQMEEAKVKQGDDNGFLGQILIDLGYISENSLTSFLAKHCKIPHLSLLDYLIDDDILRLVPKEVCIEYRLLPIDKLGRNLTIAMVNPLNAEALAKVRESCPSLRIKPILCAYSHYQAVIKKVFDIKEDGEPDGPREMSVEDFGFGTSKASKKKAKEAKKKEPAPDAAQKTPVAEEEEVIAVAASDSVIEAVSVEVIEEDEAAVVEAVEAAPAASETAEGPAKTKSVDGDTLLQAFMGDEKLDDTVVPPPPASKGALESSSIMQEMVDVMRDSMRDTYAVLARRMELFRGLSSEEVAKVFASGLTAEFETGQHIFEKGDTSDELYVVLGGKVDVMDGDRRMATIEPGGILGEMAWISDEPRSASAVAAETTSLITLSDEVFENLISKEASIQLLMNIVLILTERLRVANEGNSSS